MSAHCCPPPSPPAEGQDHRFRRALWIALAVNGLMFFIEIGAGMRSGSIALWADALDFAGDTANYGIALFVLSMALAWRARAAWLKGLTMAVFGMVVLGRGLWSAYIGMPPEPLTMGTIGLVALLANVGVAWMLYTYRSGDANMRSVWLCSRNDALGNLAVMLAAAGVFGTGSGWPDIIVAVVMASLALSSGITVMRHARQELRGRQGHGQAPQPPAGSSASSHLH
ncbi:cation transporter [Imbroritus primus]|uniref:cation transporter n=1 Tax=Imbroritus primus TaxID=3058603 RepID=UPI003D161A4B